MKPPHYATDVLWLSCEKRIESNWETAHLYLGSLKNLMKCNKNNNKKKDPTRKKCQLIYLKNKNKKIYMFTVRDKSGEQ